MKKNKTLNNTLYCIKYIWKIDAKYILLMIMIAVLTSIFNVINLSILRYITDTLTKKETGHFLGVIGVMFLLSIAIAVINGSASYLYEPLLQNRIVERIQKDIYTKAKKIVAATAGHGTMVQMLLQQVEQTGQVYNHLK